MKSISVVLYDVISVAVNGGQIHDGKESKSLPSTLLHFFSIVFHKNRV